MILTLKLEIRGRLRKWFCIPVLKKPLHITVHREISPQIDEVVLCGHRHYAKIFSVSNWLLEIHGLGRRHFKWLFSATANAKFYSLWPSARSPSSGVCYASAFDFFPPGCVILSGGRPRGNYHRRSIGEFILEKRFRGRASAVARPLATSSQRSVHILILSIPLKLFSVQVSFPFYCIFNE